MRTGRINYLRERRVEGIDDESYHACNDQYQNPDDPVFHKITEEYHGPAGI